MDRRSPARWLAFAAAFLLAQGSSATTAVLMSDADMVAASDTIVSGSVLETRSAWVGRQLVTIATVAVDEALLGSPALTVEVVLPGGIDMNRPVPIAMSWPGAPSLGVGEEVVLFLTGEDPAVGGPTIVGFSQGKFSIVTARDGSRRVGRDLRGLTLVDPAAGRRTGDVRLESLDAFRSRIRDLVVARGGRRAEGGAR
jgi:hypothetical protein